MNPNNTSYNSLLQKIEKRVYDKKKIIEKQKETKLPKPYLIKSYSEDIELLAECHKAVESQVNIEPLINNVNQLMNKDPYLDKIIIEFDTRDIVSCPTNRIGRITVKNNVL